MRTYPTALFIAVICVLFVVGCSQSATGPEQSATESTVTLANTACPIMGGPVDETVTVDWNGQTVGFCCADCIPAWNELSDEEKAEKLAADTIPQEGMSHDPS